MLSPIHALFGSGEPSLDLPIQQPPSPRDRLIKELSVSLAQIGRDNATDEAFARKTSILRQMQALFEPGRGATAEGAPEGKGLSASNAIRIGTHEVEGEIRAIALSTDGRLIATSSLRDSNRNLLTIYDATDALASGAPKALASLDLPGGCANMIFSPDGAKLALDTAGKLAVLSLRSPSGAFDLATTLAEYREPGFQLRSMCFSPDSKRIALSSECDEYLSPKEGQRNVAVLCLQSGNKLAERTFHRPIPAVAFTPDSREVLLSTREQETSKVEPGFWRRLMGKGPLEVEQSYSKIKIMPVDQPSSTGWPGPTDLIRMLDTPAVSHMSVDPGRKELRMIAGSRLMVYSLDKLDASGAPELISSQLVSKSDFQSAHFAGDRVCIVSRSFDYRSSNDDYWGGGQRTLVGGRQISTVVSLADRIGGVATLKDSSLAAEHERRSIGMSGSGNRLATAAKSPSEGRSLLVLYEV